MTTDNRTNEPTPEQVEAAAKAIADCHNPGMFEKYPENWRVEARAALVAATHVPVQGEPNDDRKALAERLRRGPLVWNPIYHVWSTVTHDVMPVVDAVIASRATVPDAATEAKNAWHLSSDVRQARALKAEAERDAALAAVERVREAITLHNPSGRLVKEVLAALDGAPEPETAPENYEPKCNGACVVHGSPVTDWPVQYGRRNRETGALHWLNGDPLDSWWHENQDSYEHVKRYTSPPLPVEGESKP